MIRKRLSVLIFATLIWSPSALPCLHGPAKPGVVIPVSQTAQQALILHDGKTEDLILAVDYNTAQADSLAWIIPVPSVPTEYGTEDGDLFSTLQKWVKLVRKEPQKPIPKGAKSAKAQKPPKKTCKKVPKGAKG